jgi:hypothetical protein
VWLTKPWTAAQQRRHQVRPAAAAAAVVVDVVELDWVWHLAAEQDTALAWQLEDILASTPAAAAAHPKLV